MNDMDTSVCTRLSDELSRLKKTHSYVADVCNVSTKTVGRWCKNVPIPADKLELLAPHGVDVLFVIYGVRFTSLERFADQLGEGASLDDLISEFYKDVKIFRSKLPNASGLKKEDSNQKKSDTYTNLDQKSQTSISDPSSATEHGSLSQSEGLTQKNEIINEESARYREKDHKNKVGSSDPTFNDKAGSDIKDYSAGSGSTMEAFAHIPLFDVKASAGNGSLIHEEEETDSLMFKREWIYNELHSSPANLYLIYVEGESMEPALRPGDVILVDHTDNIAKRDGIYVIRMGESLLVKRLQRLPNHRLKVTSDNPAYEPFEISLDFDLQNELSIIGRVVWSGRRH